MNTTLDADLIRLIDLVLKKYRAVRFDYYNNKSCITIIRETKSMIELVYENTEDDLPYELEYIYLKGNELYVNEQLRTKYNKSFKKEYKTIYYPYNLLRMIKDSNFKFRLMKALLEDAIEDGDSVRR